jgi:hypothetical protein
VRELQQRLTELISRVKGDPTSMISTVVLQGVPVSFGGCAEKPAAIVTLTNAVMDAAKTSALTTALSAALDEAYGVPADRMYLFFHEFTDPHLVGWNGKTFDRILAESPKTTKATTAVEEA